MGMVKASITGRTKMVKWPGGDNFNPSEHVFREMTLPILASIDKLGARAIAFTRPRNIDIDKMIETWVKPEDIDILRRARNIASRRVYTHNEIFTVAVHDDIKIIFTIPSEYPNALLVPDYLHYSYDFTLSSAVNPDADKAWRKKLLAGVDEWVRMSLDFALVKATFEWLNDRRNGLTREKIRYLWPAITPILRHADEVQSETYKMAAKLATTRPSHHTPVSAGMVDALVHTNQVVACNLLYSGDVPVDQDNRATISLKTDDRRHPKWSKNKYLMLPHLTDE